MDKGRLFNGKKPNESKAENDERKEIYRKDFSQFVAESGIGAEVDRTKLWFDVKRLFDGTIFQVLNKGRKVKR